MAGYSALGWLISLVTYGTLLLYDVHSTWPSIPTLLITVVSPFIVFFGLYVFGHFFVKEGGYGAQFTFSNRKNPQRLNWELQLSWIKLNISECTTLIEVAKKNNVSTVELEDRIKELEELKSPMEDLLGIKNQ